MILLLSTIVGGLVAWFAVAVGIAVVLGRMCARRDEQVACGERGLVPLHPGVSLHAASVRSSADAVERSGS